jgi:DHA1 family inner membrane transport protein
MAVATPKKDADTVASLRLLVLSVANFAVGMGAFVVIGVLSPIASDFSIGKGEAGWVMTVYAIVYAVASPLLVSLSGRADRTSVLLAGLLLFILGAALAAFAPGFAYLLGARAVMALGGALVTPVAASVGVALVAPEHRGRALAIVFGGLTLAQALGVPAGAWLGYAFGWRVTFEVVAVLSLVAGVALVRLLPRGIAVPSVSLATLGTVLASPRLVLAIAFTALFIGAIYVPYTYLAPFFEMRYGFARDGVTIMLLVFGIGAVIGNALGGVLTDRIGSFRTLTLLCAAQIVLMPVLSMVAMPVVAAGAVVSLWSVFGWSFMVAQQARLATLAPSQVPVVFALNASAIYIGGSIGSTLGGQMLKVGGLESLGPAGAMVAALAMLLLAVVARMKGVPPRS